MLHAVLLIAIFDIAALLASIAKKWKSPKFSRVKLFMPVPRWSAFTDHYGFGDKYRSNLMKPFATFYSWTQVRVAHDAIFVLLLLAVFFAMRACSNTLSGLLAVWGTNTLLNAISSVGDTDWLETLLSRKSDEHRSLARIKERAQELLTLQTARSTEKAQQREDRALARINQMGDNDNDWYHYVHELSECGGQRSVNFLESYLARLGGRNVNGVSSAIRNVSFIMASFGPSGCQQLSSFLGQFNTRFGAQEPGIVDMLRSAAELDMAAGNSLRDGKIVIGPEVAKTAKRMDRPYDAPNWSATTFFAIVLLLLSWWLVRALYR